MKTLKLSILLFVSLICSVSRAQMMVGTARPMTAINSGDVAGLLDVSNVNIIYDYSTMGVGAFRNEADYFKKKEEDYKKDPGKFEKFKESWYNSRKERFEPKFQEMFNKIGAKSGISGTNYSKNAPVTLKVSILNTEPGFNVGVAKQPAYVDMECTFLDKNGKEIVRYFIKNATGSQMMGFDYDVGSRLVESYAKAAKMLMTDVNKRLKKLKKSKK